MILIKMFLITMLQFSEYLKYECERMQNTIVRSKETMLYDIQMPLFNEIS